MTSLAALVRQRANGRCEYCLLPDSALRLPFHCEHIRARKHGGGSGLENRAHACRYCNLKKGPNIAGFDPEGGGLTPLFNPRIDHWQDHFVALLTRRGMEITGRTAIGRTSVHVLGFNSEAQVALRTDLHRRRLWPGQPAGV